MTEFLESLTEEQLLARVKKKQGDAQWHEEIGAGPFLVAGLLEEADMAERELDRRAVARRLWEATR